MSSFVKSLLASVDANAVAITDYKPLDDQRAKVIVRCSGRMTADEMADKLHATLKGQASPIRGSFKWIQEGRTAIGFIASMTPVRVVSNKAQLASMRQVAANIFMDTEDESLWDLKEGAASQYLARQGVDELPKLIEKCRVSASAAGERMSTIASSTSSSHEFVSFVNGNEVDHGFVIGRRATAANDLVVFSFLAEAPLGITDDLVISSVTTRKSQFTDMAPGMKVQAGLTDSAAMIEYYKKAYPHGQASGYLDKLIQQIEAMAAM